MWTQKCQQEECHMEMKAETGMMLLQASFHQRSVGKESTCNAGDPGDPWVGKTRWRRERLPTPVFWRGEDHGLYSPWGRKELDGKLGDFHFVNQERATMAANRWILGEFQNRCSLRAPWEPTLPARHLDLRLLASRTSRQSISVI